MLRELEELEREHPELITPDSPTQRVGGIVTGDSRPTISASRCSASTTRIPWKNCGSGTAVSCSLPDGFRELRGGTQNRRPQHRSPV